MECKAGDVVVFLLLEKLLVEGNAWGNEFGNASLYDSLGEFRIFKLVTDCNLVA